MVVLIASHELVLKTVGIATAMLQDYFEYNFSYPTLSSGLITKHAREALQMFLY